MHKIEMVVITLPTGQPAYKMISHVKSNGSLRLLDMMLVLLSAVITVT